MKIKSNKIKIALLLLSTFPFSQISFAVEALAPQLQNNPPEKSAAAKSHLNSANRDSITNPSENGPLSPATPAADSVIVTSVAANKNSGSKSPLERPSIATSSTSHHFKSNVVSIQQIKLGQTGNFYQVTGKRIGTATLVFLDSHGNEVSIQVKVQGPIPAHPVQQTVNVDKKPSTQMTIAPNQKILFKVAFPGKLISVTDSTNFKIAPQPFHVVKDPAPVTPNHPDPVEAPHPSDPGNGRGVGDGHNGGIPVVPAHPNDPAHPDPGGDNVPPSGGNGHYCAAVIHSKNGHTYDGCWQLIK